MTTSEEGRWFVGGGTSVTITGANFTGATEVDFGGIAAGFVVNSGSSITAVSPAASAGPVDVVVTADGGTSAPTAADQFSYVALAPTVTGVSPSVGPVDGGSGNLTGGKRGNGGRHGDDGRRYECRRCKRSVHVRLASAVAKSKPASPLECVHPSEPDQIEML